MKLYQYVEKNAIRGACQCERCADAPDHPEQHQPDGHTADLVFFKVAKTNNADKETFISLVRAEFPKWLDGKEHNYMEIGGDIGDQGLALMAMGLGSLLGAWKLMTPNSVMPFLPDEMKMQMAGMGMITVEAQ